MKKPSAGKILVGPAGWSYADWEGIVYPRNKPRGFHAAAYLAQYFDTIEINTSFYNPLRAEVAAGWVDKVRHNPNFQFTAKLWKRFTHEREASLRMKKICKQGLDPACCRRTVWARCCCNFPGRSRTRGRITNT